MGEALSIAATGGQSFNAYVAKPGTARGPAILILQEIFGVNSHIRAVCDLYAQIGGAGRQGPAGRRRRGRKETGG